MLLDAREYLLQLTMDVLGAVGRGNAGKCAMPLCMTMRLRRGPGFIRSIGSNGSS